MRGTWQSTGSGGGGLVLAVIVIVAAAAIGSGTAAAAVTALVTIVAIVTGCAVGLVVIGGGAWLICRTRPDRRRRPITAQPVELVPPESRPRLEGSHKVDRSASRSTPAIEPPREIHLHLTVSPDQLAAIVRHHLEED